MIISKKQVSKIILISCNFIVKDTKILIQKMRRDFYDEKIKLEQDVILEEMTVFKAEKQFNAVKNEYNKYAPVNPEIEQHNLEMQTTERFETDTHDS